MRHWTFGRSADQVSVHVCLSVYVCLSVSANTSTTPHTTPRTLHARHRNRNGGTSDRSSGQMCLWLWVHDMTHLSHLWSCLQLFRVAFALHKSKGREASARQQAALRDAGTLHELRSRMRHWVGIFRVVFNFLAMLLVLLGDGDWSGLTVAGTCPLY